MSAGWWWYPFIKEDLAGWEVARPMRVPTRAELKSLAEIESELEKEAGADTRQILAHAVNVFAHSRDEEIADHYVERTTKEGKPYTQHWEDHGSKPWEGVRSMWALFISQAPVWIQQGREELARIRKYAAIARG